MPLFTRPLHDPSIISIIHHCYCVQVYVCGFSPVSLHDIHLYLWPILLCTPPPVFFCSYTQGFLCLSWCSSPGLSCEQIAALFTSLVINITHCTATFAGNNTDSGASALLRVVFSVLFLSWPHCCAKKHYYEQQAHSIIPRSFGFLLILFFSFLSNSHFIYVEWCYLWLQAKSCDWLTEWLYSR